MQQCALKVRSYMNNTNLKKRSCKLENWVHVMLEVHFFSIQARAQDVCPADLEEGREMRRKEDGHLKTLCRLLFEFDVCNACGM